MVAADRSMEMSCGSLNKFIRLLEERGELIRIKEPVSRDLEITEITDRISKAGGPALLFEKVEESDYPVFINAFGSYERMSLSLGAKSLDDIGDEIEEYIDFSHYTSIPRLIKFSPKLFRLLCCFPIRKPFTLGRPPCQQIIEHSPDLDTLPVLKCWPLDGGRFFTLPLVFTKYYRSKSQNVGMYRMQVLDKTSTAMHWHKHKDGAGIYEDYCRNNVKMPVSVALGASPAVSYAATAPMPPKLDEMMLAGFLGKKPVSMVKSITNDIYVPSDAQFILEGYVDPKEPLVWEGPFGDHTGYYSLADWYPRFHVTCITHRKKALYPATVVGKPPMEDCYMAKATERIFLPLLRLQMPQLVNLNLPLSGVFHNCAIVSVKQSYPGVSTTLMNHLWGMGQMRYTKMIITVGEEINPYDTCQVRKAVLENVDFSRDLTFSKGPLDALDHSSDQALYGTRLGVDACVKDREPENKAPEKGRLLIVTVKKRKPGDGKRMAEETLAKEDAKLIIVVDHTEDITDFDLIMWRVFNNIDAARDLILKDSRMAVDATRKTEGEGIKRPWPEDILMTEHIKEKVTKKWQDYGLGSYCIIEGDTNECND